MKLTNVKNTMQMPLAETLAPHYCISCGEIDGIFCGRCVYDSISDTFVQCVKCLVPTQNGGLCRTCRVAAPYREAWCTAIREGALAELLDAYKFERVKSARLPLAELLDGVLPLLLADTVITSIPTIAPHIRRRGYDHAELVARELARRRSLPYRRLLVREGATVQLGATKKQRLEYARRAFRPIRPKGALSAARVLLVDDVYTTGASVEYATRALLAGGVNEVYVAVIARQILD